MTMGKISCYNIILSFYLSTSFPIWPKTMYHQSFVVPQSRTKALIKSGLVRCLIEQVLTAMETKYSGALVSMVSFHGNFMAHCF